ncbi:MAG: stress responsive protein [Marinilabiliales bacterium]|nr:MAG: stress responsive protein [Marinilabiliales bacterium]
MIRHCVFFTFQEEANGKTRQENLLEAQKLILAMEGRIPGMLSIDCGLNFTIDDAAWDIALFCTFETEEDLTTYQTHPIHQEVVKFIRQVRDKRAVVDWR